MFVKVWRNRRRSHQTVHDDLEMVAAQKTRPLFDDRKKTLVSSLEFNECTRVLRSTGLSVANGKGRRKKIDKAAPTSRTKKSQKIEFFVVTSPHFRDLDYQEKMIDQ